MMKNKICKLKKTGISVSSAMVLAVLLAFPAFMGSSCTKGQEIHCMDPFAINYNPDNPPSGKCRYPEIHKSPVLQTQLASKIRETSGLAYFSNTLITHNDKGGANELYVISPANGQVQATITISNALNIDWEDLTNSQDHLYIGDFGNNDGNRQNLAIYKVEKDQIDGDTDKTISVVSQTGFFYPEQKSFKSGSKHNFDCEAFVYLDGNFYLFTKNRTNGFTHMYRVSDQAGIHAAVLMDSLEVGVMITGAALSTDGSKLALLGYNKDKDCEIWLFELFTDDQFFKAKKTRYLLGKYSTLGQMEGIAFRNDNSVWISSEQITSLSPRLYVLDLN